MKERQSRTIAARKRIEELRAALSRQKARRESLEEILSHRAYTTESVKRLFLGLEHGQIEGFKPSGVLADFVEVADPAWEKACEVFLHEELEYVVVSGWRKPSAAWKSCAPESDGRATFLVHPEASAASPLAPDLSAHPGVVGRLRDTLRLTNGFAQAPQGLLPRLARCFLVSDRATAQRFRPPIRIAIFCCRMASAITATRSAADEKRAGGPLALKRELRELTAQVESTQREADQLTAELEELERGTALLAEDLERIRVQQQSQEKDALALDHEQRKLAEEYARSGSRLSVARLELDRLSQGRSAQPRAARAEPRLGRRKRAGPLRSGKSRSKNRAANSSGCRRTRTRIGEEHAALRAELAGLEERARSDKSTAARLEAQIRPLVYAP